MGIISGKTGFMIKQGPVIVVSLPWDYVCVAPGNHNGGPDWMDGAWRKDRGHVIFLPWP